MEDTLDGGAQTTAVCSPSRLRSHRPTPPPPRPAVQRTPPPACAHARRRRVGVPPAADGTPLDQHLALLHHLLHGPHADRLKEARRCVRVGGGPRGDLLRGRAVHYQQRAHLQTAAASRPDQMRGGEGEGGEGSVS